MKRIAAALAVLLIGTSAAHAREIVLKDPTGDDKGPGKYSYPTDPAYKRGSFDLTYLKIKDKGSTVEFRVGVNAAIGDPWNSKAWRGNGFSLQMVQVYINTRRGGFRGALKGINVKFVRGHAWDKVVFISPQPKSKIVAQVKAKARKKLRGLVVPQRTYARGRELVAIVRKADLGKPRRSWGYQAVMQSNEGYAKADSVLARKVNQYAGAHAFGGGNDYNCDPHVMDIFAGKAKGAASERAAQYKQLGSFTCNANGRGKKAEIRMIYPGK